MRNYVKVFVFIFIVCLLLSGGWFVWVLYKPVSVEEKAAAWKTMLNISRKAIYDYWVKNNILPDSTIGYDIDGEHFSFDREIKGIFVAKSDFVPIDPFFQSDNNICIFFESRYRFSRTIEICGSPLKYIKLDESTYILVSAGNDGIYNMVIDREKILSIRNDYIRPGNMDSLITEIDGDLVYLGILSRTAFESVNGVSPE